MFRLPKCPYCGTVYHYRDVKRAAKRSENTCYHCHKKFKAGRMPGALIAGAILLILCIGTNLLILSRMKTLNMIILFAVTVAYIVLFLAVNPFFVKFRKNDNEEKKRR